MGLLGKLFCAAAQATPAVSSAATSTAETTPFRHFVMALLPQRILVEVPGPVPLYRSHRRGCAPPWRNATVAHHERRVCAMNQHAKVATSKPVSISPEEWQARADLAAVYRLCAHYGWDDLIYNHCSMRVPGEPSKFLMKQHELLWTEVTASNLRKVDMNDDLDERSGVNRPGFTLHGGVLKGRADVNCAVHVHTETGMALAGLKHGLRMISQQAMRFYQRIGYHPYEGITEDFSERDRILKALSSHRARV